MFRGTERELLKEKNAATGYSFQIFVQPGMKLSAKDVLLSMD